MPKTNYTKPYLTVPKQIDLLKSRGMVIQDENQAQNDLQTMGYYRLSGYWYPFQKRDDTDPAKVTNVFIDGTTFQQVKELYIFDRKLRSLFLNGIERVEIALKVDIALLLGERDPWAHRKANFLNHSFQKTTRNQAKSKHDTWLEKLEGQENRSQQEFVVRYFKKYNTPLPLWMSIEVWDFGLMSHLLAALKDKDQTRIADKYNLRKRDILTSWIRSINFARNVCAHHSRLWNISPVIKPKFSALGDIQELDHIVTDQNAKIKIYAHALTIQYLLKTIDPTNDWNLQLKNLIDTFPQITNISLANMGFPANWQQLDLWQ